MITCYICNREAEDNEDFFFDVSDTLTGKDVGERFDTEICIDCIFGWIDSKGFEKINLIRRITNPLYG